MHVRISMFNLHIFPENTKRWPNVCPSSTMLHRLRRWHNISLTLGQRLVFAGCVTILDLVLVSLNKYKYVEAIGILTSVV